jgi:hypothetical protein
MWVFLSATGEEKLLGKFISFIDEESEMKKNWIGISTFFGWVLIAVLALGACTSSPAGQLRTESESVELGAAQSARVQIDMGAGKLQVAGGATKLMEAEFTYNIDAWKPNVNYNVQGSEGVLTVQQPAAVELDPNLTDYRYEWSLDFNNDVPIDMTIRLGAGDNTLNLGQLNLTNLSVGTGAGQVIMDLSGAYQQDLQAFVTGGVGDVHITLPKDTGVRATVQGGLGSVVATGFERDGDAYVNPAYGTSDHTINLAIKGGVGQVTLDLGG